MWVTKYDYSALKLEFFQSDYDEVKSFLSGKWVKYNTKRWENTRGRTKEKKERKEKIVEKALERKQNELAKKLEIPMEQLLESKKVTIQLTRKKLKYYWDMKDSEIKNIDLSDLEKIYKITKTELWEPTSVSKNENTNKNTNELSQEDRELIDNYFKNKNNDRNWWDDCK